MRKNKQVGRRKVSPINWCKTQVTFKRITEILIAAEAKRRPNEENQPNCGNTSLLIRLEYLRKYTK
ncbi:hypothetical protein [Wolbachia endosymbiont of Pentidionis agamae]|uniref:hypothetical protein n=1 Tax=Wolbachia endosymbiont of Pentidionis agamae TaxID=3110435 RepID=UPI002FD4C669